MIILNFSHPLSDAGSKKLAEMLPGAVVHTIPVHLDTAAPIQDQLDRIVSDALASVPEIDGSPYMVSYVILPGLSFAAGYVARRFPDAGIIVVTRDSNPIPGFLPTQILHE